MKTRYGLVLRRGRVLWAPYSGHLRWLPEWSKRVITTAWNKASCAVLGHDDVLRHIPEDHEPDGSFPCVNCGTRLTPRDR